MIPRQAKAGEVITVELRFDWNKVTADQLRDWSLVVHSSKASDKFKLSYESEPKL